MAICHRLFCRFFRRLFPFSFYWYWTIIHFRNSLDDFIIAIRLFRILTCIEGFGLLLLIGLRVLKI